MTDILALLQPIQNSVSKTTLRQLSRIIVAMIAMTERVTMLGLSRWTEKGGSYRSVQRFFYTAIPWAQVFWVFFQAGIRHLWTDKPMRFIFTVVMVVNFLLIGPILVGIPVLADQRLPEGATAFGLLMSAFAGGNLLGYLVAGSLPRPNGAKLRLMMIALFAGFGIVIGSLGVITSTWIDVGLLLLLSLGNGFIVVLLMTWLQTRTPGRCWDE